MPGLKWSPTLAGLFLSVILPTAAAIIAISIILLMGATID